tara:strand:- start:2812 stop:2967 length:156 start_codon:yes stop_codon:yes gene_type:complete
MIVVNNVGKSGKVMFDIKMSAEKNNFILNKKIESYRKTGFGNRWVLYFRSE